MQPTTLVQNQNEQNYNLKSDTQLEFKKNCKNIQLENSEPRSQMGDYSYAP